MEEVKSIIDNKTEGFSMNTMMSTISNYIGEIIFFIILVILLLVALIGRKTEY